MSNRHDTRAVWWLNEPDSAVADRATADKIGMVCVFDKPTSGFYLSRDSHGLALHCLEAPTSNAVRCDLLAEAARRGVAGVKQMPLSRACGLHRARSLHIIDATAGLARDSITLACTGSHVQPLERHPALFALLNDAYRQMRRLPVEARPNWFAHLAPPIHANAIEWLASKPQIEADLIYLDPMFDSPRRKAKPQKALAWLAALAGPDADAVELLAIARKTAKSRVVAKRHARAAPLAPAHHQVSAKAVRFDVYLTPR